MLELFLGLSLFLAAVSAVSVIVACLLGYYVLTVAERVAGRSFFSGMGRIAFSFVLGLPVAYALASARAYGPFAFLLSLSVFLAIGVYSFLRVGRGGRARAERHAPLRRQEIAGFEEERPVKKYRLREKRGPSFRIFELGGEGDKSANKAVEAGKKAPKKEEGGLFGFLESIPNPLKAETSAEKAAKEFVLTRFGEKGSVERTWEKGGKKCVAVRSSGGRYTLTLNSENVVVDWDKN